MSGSTRAIVLSLSVKDAGVVRDQLEQMGAAGETALKRLDAAASRAAGAGGLPRVREETDKATNSFGGLRNAVQQGGYQLGDFVVQVQGGTSALTALSQQGSQFLGMFGPAGAVAGVVLSIGTIAASFLTTASNADLAKQKGQEALDAMSKSGAQTATVLREINDLFLSAGQRAANLANIQRNQLRTQAQARLEEITAGRQELARRLAADEGYLQSLGTTPGQIWGGQGRSVDVYRAESNADRDLQMQATVRVRDLRSELAAADREAEKLRGSLSALDRAGQLGPEEFGPTTRDPFGTDALRASADKAFKIRQDFEGEVLKIRAALREGHLEEAEANRLISNLAKTRDEDLARLNGSASGSRRAASEELAQMRAEARGLATVWETLRRDGQSGLLVGSENDLTALRAIRDARKGSILDPAEVKKRADESAKILKDQQRAAERTTDDVVRYGSDLFADMFATTEGGWDRAWQNMGRTARGILARIAAEAIIRPIIAPVIGSFMGGTGQAATAVAGTAGGTGGGMGGVGSLFSGARDLWNSWGNGSVSTGLDTWGANNLGMLGFSGGTGNASSLLAGGDFIGGGMGYAGSMPGVASGAGLLNGGSALGGFSAFSNVLGVAGAALPGLMSGNYVQAGLGLGGAALGTMILPGVGTVIGGMAGNLLGGLFGGQEKNPAGSVQLGTDAAGNLTVLGSKSKNFDMGEALAGANQTVAGLNTNLQSRGLRLNADTAISQIHYGKDKNDTDQGDMVRSILANLTGGTTSVMAVVAKEIAKGTAASLETAFANIDWVKGVFEPLTSTAPVVSAFEQSITALNQTYDAATTKAKELGFETAVLAQKQGEAVAKAIAARDLQYANTGKSIYARQLAAQGDETGAALINFDLQAEQQRIALKTEMDTLGVTGAAYVGQLQLLEDTLWTERKNIAEQGAKAIVEADKQARDAATSSAASSISSLADYARSLSFGEGSSLSAQDQFSLAQRQFNAVSGSAVAGDANSISQLQGYAQTYLQASQSLYGSGTGYQDARQRVQDALGQIGGLNADTLTASFLATQTQDLKQSLVAELQELRAAVDRMTREQQMALTRPRAA